MKQIIHSKGNIVEKVLRDKEGKLIRARFFVYENGGRIKARLLDFVCLTEQILLSSANFLLSVASKTKELIFKSFEFSLATSHFELKTVFITGSKPRAPTSV